MSGRVQSGLVEMMQEERRGSRGQTSKQENKQQKNATIKQATKQDKPSELIGAGGMTLLQQTVQLWLAQALAPAAADSVKSIYWEKPPTTTAPAFGLSQVLRRGLMPAGSSSSSKLWTLPRSSLSLHFSFSLKNAKWGQTKQHDVQQITRSSSFIFRNIVALFWLQFAIQIWNSDCLLLI